MRTAWPEVSGTPLASWVAPSKNATVPLGAEVPVTLATMRAEEALALVTVTVVVVVTFAVTRLVVGFWVG